jgi:hypothetical protein
MPNHENPEATAHRCGRDCGCVVSERNRYFTGKFLTARDLAGEQQYLVGRHRLHNRLLHGWGVVCGLRVSHHPDPDCARRWVEVQPGIAIDCHGREVVLCRAERFELPLPRPEGDDEDADVMREEFLLCASYVEEAVELVPALYAEGTCDATRQEANRIRETMRLEVVRMQDVHEGCWRGTRHHHDEAAEPQEQAAEHVHDAHCRDDCDGGTPGPAGTCLVPWCPCGERVPLARIHPRDPRQGWASGFAIDLLGRRELPPAPEHLTHIRRISWPHGGSMSLHDMCDHHDRKARLKVHFDRKLRPAEGDRTGINQFTFVVQYGDIQRTLEFLPYDCDEPPTIENECVAVFTIDPNLLRNTMRDHLCGKTVYVTLKCDFILDCHGKPVDGNHLQGRLPSGDGTPGGIFESWFVIDYDRDDRERSPRHANR